MEQRMTPAPLILQPLLPPPVYSWLDLLVPPICIGASLLLHVAYNPQYVSTQAKLYWMKTYHARFLPQESQHQFQYSTINVGADLDALEAGDLDLGSRWFAYDVSRWSLFAFKSHMFSSLPTSTSDKAASTRVRRHLIDRDLPQQNMAKIYTVAMPAYAGFEGINPLVVHYCYSMSDQKLRIVVLEVHNTFEERHIYVLQTGVDEDEAMPPKYEHQWTFPRSFHVSPFNDRSGYYQVSLIDPLVSSSYSIKIRLLQEDRRKKLVATLEGWGEPLTESAILQAALLYPFSLLLTSARILYQAFILHYFKKLNVFARPELHAGQHQSDNPVHPEAAIGSIHWQQPSSTQVFLRQQFESALRQRVLAQQEPIEVIIRPADFTQPTTHISNATNATESAVLTFHSYSAFEVLFVVPTFEKALQLGSVQGTLEVQNPTLFKELLDHHSSATPDLNLVQAACGKIRKIHHRWLSGEHPLYREPDWVAGVASWTLLGTLLRITSVDALSYYLSKLLRAEFVENGSPWQVWDRVKKTQSMGSTVRPRSCIAVTGMKQTETTDY